MTKVKKKNKPTVKEYLRERLTHVPLTVIMALFLVFCIGSIVYFIVIGQYRDITIALAYMAIVFVFYLAEWSLNVRAPMGYVVFMMLFVLFCFLGASYNFYGMIPCLDDILHAAWGIVFSVVGVILCKSLIGAPKTAKGVIACVLFGVGFAMLLSVVWEIYEYSGDKLLHNMDMQQDTLVNHFHSFFLHDPYDNLHTVEINGIAYTILYDAAGNEIYRIEGGYLDLGLIDTMQDLIFCFATTAIFSIILAVDWCKGKYIYRFLIPALRGEKYGKGGVMIEEAASPAEEEACEEPAEKETEDNQQEPQTVED
ncbi:MAG: hypothetical protein K2L72_05515 [Clostridia bacterium]|nr:hypothetical protein [Clostridia bacterium]